MNCQSLVSRISWAFVAAVWVTAAVSVAGCGPGADTGSNIASTKKYEVAEESSPAATEGGPSSPEPETGPVDAGGAESPAAARPARPLFEAAPPKASPPAAAVAGEPARQPAPSSAVPQQPPVVPPGSMRAEAPAGDDPQKLLAYIRELQGQQPRGTTRAEALADFQTTQNAILEAADKVLQKQVDPPIALAACEAKMKALRTLSQLGDKERGQQYTSFYEQLIQSGNAALARLGRREQFATKLDDLINGQTDNVQGIVEEFTKWFAAEEKDAQALQLGQEVASVLESRGYAEQSLATLRLVYEAFASSNDPLVKKSVARIQERLVALELVMKVRALDEGKPGALEELTQGVDALLAGESLGAMAFGLAREIAYVLEASEPVAASQLFTKIGAAFQNHPDRQLAAQAERLVEMYKRRAALLGQPLVVEGKTWDGRPFDWSRYRNKVVLIDFWATWCGPCLAEIPNIKKNYELYHDQGFEVVGVNLDEQPQDLEQFLSLQPLPWTTVVSADAKARGFDHPLATKCGIEAIPFLVLLDRAGTAIALNLRGEALGKKLAELFGPPSKS